MRDPQAVLIQQRFPEQFAAAAAKLGAEPANLSDDEFRNVAGNLLLEHAPELATNLLVSEGLAIDPNNAPATFLEKAAQAGVTHRGLLEFVDANFDVPGDRLKAFQAELAKAKKYAEQPADPNRRFGNPY
jgi:hypothetical protein